jgi:hypothetical protein
MTRAGLLARGFGERHPEVLSVDALLAECPSKDGSSLAQPERGQNKNAPPSAASCKRVNDELIEKRQLYGEGHPIIVSLRTMRDLCPK